MDSRENNRSMIPAVETISPEAPSTYQLAPRNDNSTLLIGPPGFSPLSGGSGGGGVSGGGIPSSLVKKKRGRPRKYGPDGVVAGGSGESGRTLSPIPISASAPPASGEIKFGEAEGSGSFLGEKKKKVKMNTSYGSVNLGDKISSGGSFTPHMVTVNAGEDVTSKIISFTKDGPRSICVLSALGVISHVTLRHSSSSGATVTYEGRFEILSLTGSFTQGEDESSRESKMSIALSSPDGRVVGGQLGGLLTAAGPVQVVVASFLPNIGSPIEPKYKKQKSLVNKLSTPTETNVEQKINFNEHRRESIAAENTRSTPAPTPTPTRNFQLDNAHEWRRAATDMNVSLSED